MMNTNSTNPSPPHLHPDGTQILTYYYAASCRVLFLMSKSGYQPPKLKDKSKWYMEHIAFDWIHEASQ